MESPQSRSYSKAKQTKEQIKVHLANRDIDAVLSWAKEVRNPLRILSSVLFEDDQLIYWRAIEAIGKVAEQMAMKNEEKAAKQIQYYLWQMNDESGGLCRRGPEAIAEILIHVPSLIPRFINILPSYLWEEPFERGTRLALLRLITKRPETSEVICKCIGDLAKSLEHSDKGIRGYSALLMHAINENQCCASVEIPEIESVKVPFYDFDSGELIQRKIPLKKAAQSGRPFKSQ